MRTRICSAVIAAACAAGICAAQDPAKGMTLAQEKTQLLAALDGTPVLRYRFAEVPFKPYVQELYTPDGVNILRDAPSDHLHHHALMYAMNVNGIDFWGEAAGAGTQAHRAFVSTSADGAARARFQETLAWIDPATTKAVLDETRTITVLRPEALRATIVSWVSEFSVPEGATQAALSGSHYHGLGMRFAVSMDSGGEFRNSAGTRGEVYRGEERLAPADWCAYTAKAGDKVVTAAMFGLPRNVRSPTLWFIMSAPFAYLSATMGLYKEPLTIERGKPLVLTYGVAVWDGRPDDATIAMTYARWVARMQRAAADDRK
ncbi:MAG TPA: hypothetical protein DCM87_21320 [Planctomycetes bacterium]|nr:hypothetical protein [Planctomycetota bacterium]